MKLFSLTLLLLISFSAIAGSEWYSTISDYIINSDQEDGNVECNDQNPIVKASYEALGKELIRSCKENHKKRNDYSGYCNCINAELKNFQKQRLATDFSRVNSNREEQMNKKRKEFETKFDSAYEQMIFGLQIQNEIINSESDKVECTPAIVSSYAYDANEKYVETRKKFLEDQLAKIQKEYGNKCKDPSLVRKLISFSFKKNCQKMGVRINEIENKIKDNDKFHKESIDKLADPDMVCLDNNSFNRNIEELKRIKLEVDVDNKTALDEVNLKKVNSLLTSLEKYEETNKFDKQGKVPVFGSGNVLNFSNSSNAENSCRRPEDSEQETLIKSKVFINSFTLMKTQYSESSSDSACSKDEVCKKFQEKNKTFEKKNQDKYMSDHANACFTFGEYKTFKSLPINDRLFKEIAKSNNPVALLQPDSHDKEKLSFLRSNPILTSFLMHPDDNLKTKLNGMLKKLSNDMLLAKSDADKLKTYLQFLKGNDGLAGLKNSNDRKTQQLSICADIARNYNLIKQADYLPDEDDLFDSIPKKVKKEVNECKETTSTAPHDDPLKVLALDPLFTIGDENQNLSEEQEDRDYQRFLKNECVTANGQTYKDFLSKTCPNETETAKLDECRQQFLKLTGLGKIKDVYNDSGVNSDLSHMPPGGLLPGSGGQDTDFINWFNHNILPNYNQDPTGMFGIESYLANRKAEQDFISRTPMPQSSKNSFASNRESSPPSDLRRKGRDLPNPGQVQPRFNVPTQSNQAMANSQTPSRQPASLGIDPLRDNTNVRKPNIRANSDDKWSSGTQSPQYPNSQDSKLGKADLDKLAEDNNKLKDLNTSMAKKDSEVSSNNSQGGTVSGAVASSGPIPAGSQSSFSFARGSKSVALGESPEKKGTYNDALNNIHEKSALTVLGGVIDPSEFKGPQQSAKDLIVDDPKKFEKLGEDPALLEAFIKEKMKGMAIGESKIITIINASPNRPVPHMIFRIKAKADGSFDIQSVPSEVPVRVATLKSLIDQLPKR